jgi:hypothetical protein
MTAWKKSIDLEADSAGKLSVIDPTTDGGARSAI